MILNELKCIDNNVSLDDYYKLYNDVRNSMENPEYLGIIPREETEEYLKIGGKIWLYYDNDKIVCSMFYLPTTNESLKEHNILSDESITGSLGPIMVNKEYQGNGLMNQMLEVFDEYNKSINNKFIFSKAAKNNKYSVNNFIKNNYKITDEWENERGLNVALLKEL